MIGDFTPGHRERRTEPKDFVADSVEVGNVVDLNGRGKCLCLLGSSGIGKVGADFRAQAGLDVWVLCEETHRPYYSRGGRLVAMADARIVSD